MTENVNENDLEMNLFRELMTKHVADSLDSVALCSLLWHDDVLSTTSGASVETARDSEYDSIGDETQIEVTDIKHI